MGNWNSSQITQLDQVLLSTDSVPALSKGLFALSKYLVNRIDAIWFARQKAAYHTALSRTPEADPATLRILQRRCLKRRTNTVSAFTVFYAVRLGHVPGIYTSWREAESPTPLALSLTSSASLRGRELRSTCPSPRALEIPCLMTPLRSSLLTALLSQTAPQAGGFTSPSRA